MNTENKEENFKGVRIRNVNYGMMIITLVSFVLLIWMSIKTYNYYEDLKTSTENYITGQQAASDMREASDYLTEQVRLFVSSGDIRYVQAYFEEVDNTRRRDKAIECFKELGMSEKLVNELNTAMEWSQELMHIECKAMLISSYGYGLDINTLPKAVQNAKLSEQELNLSAQAQREAALNYVFNDTYKEYKDIIYENLEFVTAGEMEYVYSEMEHNDNQLHRSLTLQRAFIIILFVVNVAMFAIVIMLVIQPLKNIIRNIQEDSLIDVIGSYELKYLALTYNRIYELNNEKKSLLQYKAEHDNLTGMLNRAAFNSITKHLIGKSISLALMIVDIDKFKMINDTYGHEVGDRIIQKVSKTIEREMRSGDKVTRFGGDEFAIIIMDISHDSKAIIEQKIHNINQKLTKSIDELPTVSISAGVAFSSVGYQEQLFKNADEALYAAKEVGRNACVISDKVL